MLYFFLDGVLHLHLIAIPSGYLDMSGQNSTHRQICSICQAAYMPWCCCCISSGVQNHAHNIVGLFSTFFFFFFHVGNSEHVIPQTTGEN